MSTGEVYTILGIIAIIGGAFMGLWKWLTARLTAKWKQQLEARALIVAKERKKVDAKQLLVCIRHAEQIEVVEKETKQNIKNVRILLEGQNVMLEALENISHGVKTTESIKKQREKLQQHLFDSAV